MQRYNNRIRARSDKRLAQLFTSRASKVRFDRYKSSPSRIAIVSKSEMASSEATHAEYGSWESPITAKFITSSTTSLASVKVSPTSGAIYWLEGRPQEKGRYVVVRMESDGTSVKDMVGKDVNVRTRVHEYGGGAWMLGPQGDNDIIYSDYVSQRLFRTSDASTEPKCLTPPAKDEPHSGRYRYADGCLIPGGTEAVFIREDHGIDGCANPKDVINEVVSVALDGSGKTKVLASGRDFYLSPRVSKDGKWLAYVCYDHPSMPWDTTELRVRPLTDDSIDEMKTTSHLLVDGGDGDTSIMQPAWHPSSNALYYISDSTGFYTIRRLPPDALNSNVRPGDEVLCQDGADFGGKSPGWMLGQQGYVFLNSGGIAAHVPDRVTGTTILVVCDEPSSAITSLDAESIKAHFLATKRTYGEKDGLPNSFGSIELSPDEKTMYMLGGASDTPSSIYAWSLLGGHAEQENSLKVLKCSTNADIKALSGYISIADPIEYESTLGVAYGMTFDYHHLTL